MQLLTLRAAVIFLIAVVAGIVVFNLTRSAGRSISEAGLAALFAAGGTLPILTAVIA
jgi:hypothetical protein